MEAMKRLEDSKELREIYKEYFQKQSIGWKEFYIDPAPRVSISVAAWQDPQLLLLEA